MKTKQRVLFNTRLPHEDFIEETKRLYLKEEDLEYRPSAIDPVADRMYVITAKRAQRIVKD